MHAGDPGEDVQGVHLEPADPAATRPLEGLLDLPPNLVERLRPPEHDEAARAPRYRLQPLVTRLLGEADRLPASFLRLGQPSGRPVGIRPRPPRLRQARIVAELAEEP